LALILSLAKSVLAAGNNLTEMQRCDLEVIRRNAATLLQRVNHLPGVARDDTDDGVSRLTARMIADKQALQDSERRWRAIFENSAVGVGLTDATGRVLAENPTFRRILGYTEEEFRTISLADITSEEDLDAIFMRVAQLLDGGLHEYHVQQRYRRKDGNFVWTNTSVSLIPGTGTAPTTLVRIVEDITDRKHAEEALRRAHEELAHVTRVMSMGELTASIAHEVNQPLAAVVTNGHACARWLAAVPPDLREASEAVQRVVRDANRASEVIARVRAFLRRGQSQRSRLDLDEVIIDVLGFVQDEIRIRGVSLRVALAARLPPVLADRVQLQQVILNLLVNGIEAMSVLALMRIRPMLLILTAPSTTTKILFRAMVCGACNWVNEFRHSGSNPHQRQHYRHPVSSKNTFPFTTVRLNERANR
jgi:PAS domain S-box-containing protein